MPPQITPKPDRTFSCFTVGVCALVAILCHSNDACAADGDPTTSIFSLSGFGTLGVVHSSEDEADFTSTLFKPKGAGYSHAWSADVDSLIAAQVTAGFTPQLTAVLQVISEQNYDGSYRPHVEWANIKYEVTPDFSVRFGRTVEPAFLLSDTRKVAYAFPWVRPPSEVYFLLPITHADGLDVSYRQHAGELTNTLQATFGKANPKLPTDLGGSVHARHLSTISDTLEYGPLTLRIAYQRVEITVPPYNAFFNIFRQFGAQGRAIADHYDVSANLLTFAGLGASYDPGNWFVMSEWGRNQSESALGTKTAWYVSGGYRIAKFTPFVTYSEGKADNLSDPGLTVDALPAFLAGPATGLNAALNAILRSKPAENTISVGGRWDFMKKADLKLQYDHTRIGAGSKGLLSDIQPGLQPGGRVDFFSATVDFVF